MQARRLQMHSGGLDGKICFAKSDVFEDLLMAFGGRFAKRRILEVSRGAG
jgi:hypothetical protein